MARKEQAVSLQKEISLSNVSKRIFTLRGRQVMLDRDLAEIYEVETRIVKRQVRSNADRFPEDFMFELTEEELANLRSQFDTSSVENASEVSIMPNLRSKFRISSLESDSKSHGGTRYIPMAFTELGVAMLSSVLHSQRAIQLNIEIMRVFVQLRKEQRSLQSDLLPKLESLEKMFTQRFDRIEFQFRNQAPANHDFVKPDPVSIIQNAVAHHWGIAAEDLKSAVRSHGVSLPRQVAIYLVRKYLGLAFSEIGKQFGHRDHTTILHAYHKIAAAKRTPLIRSAIESLETEIQPLLTFLN